MAKNIQSISRLLRERPHPGLRNEPPLDSLDPQSLNPFMASLWIGSGEGLAIKGFGDWGSRLSSGGSFWSPRWGLSRSSLEIDWIFFCHFNLPESAVCNNSIHRTSRKIEMAKKIQSISRLLQERPHPGLQKEPPLDSLDPQSPNPFMASSSPEPIQRLAIKGFREVYVILDPRSLDEVVRSLEVS